MIIKQTVQRHCSKIVSDVRHCLSCGVRQGVQHCQSFIWDLPTPYEVNPFVCAQACVTAGIVTNCVSVETECIPRWHHCRLPFAHTRHRDAISPTGPQRPASSPGCAAHASEPRCRNCGSGPAAMFFFSSCNIAQLMYTSSDDCLRVAGHAAHA